MHCHLIYNLSKNKRWRKRASENWTKASSIKGKYSFIYLSNCRSILCGIIVMFRLLVRRFAQAIGMFGLWMFHHHFIMLLFRSIKIFWKFYGDIINFPTKQSPKASEQMRETTAWIQKMEEYEDVEKSSMNCIIYAY